ncbi:MAG: tetratricopeptide repeat protein [Candidatus Poribacteria bacterium]|nr:tetratricopeptide repeat protein [Candidatus Poribacteria bacterium]
MELKKDNSTSTDNPQPHLSVGTLTLMFTDIEGSTLLWEKHGNEVMAEVINTHNTILRAANSAWGGTEIQNDGDAFFFIFPTASAAVMCALEIQLVLNAYQWHGTIEALRVRIGIHTGDMILLDDKYHGMPANLAKRITDAGHGGQILLSAVTHTLVKTQFPPGSFIALGEHRLKNIQHPEAIFQFRAPQASISKITGEKRWQEVFSKTAQEDISQDGKPADNAPIHELQTEFPPLKTVNNLPNNLPAPINSFIGRETEVRCITEYFTDRQDRLVTLTGPGGIGKTRLSLRVATELHDTYPDGVWFIALADLKQPKHVITEIATALALPLKSTQDVMEQVISHLSGKTLLLVLDNFEHLMEASQDIKTLLLRCPTLYCLATSREPLKIAGEQRFVVPPLSVPSEDVGYEALHHYESVQLFLARAEAVAPDFQLTADNAETIGAICRMVDGISLAIELAAARVRAMTPQHILDRLKILLESPSSSKPSALLSTSNRDVPARHQTLDAVIDWSYELLEPEEQLLLRQLALFSGGFFLEAAETICSSAYVLAEQDLPYTETIDLIFNLHDKSLLMIEEYLMRTRYRLPVAVQLYLREKQQPTGFREAHAHYYLTLAQEQDKKLEGPEQSDALSEMAIELDNFRAVFGFAQENNEWLLFGQLAIALSEFFYVRGLWNEGLEWLKQAETELHQRLEEYQGLEDMSETDEMSVQLTIADIRVALAKFYNERQECETARQLCEDALQVFRTAGQQLGVIKALNRLGIIARYQENLEEADIHFTEALELARVLDNKWHIAFSLNNLGLTAYDRRHFEEAKLRYTESLHLARELEDKPGIAYALNNLGKTANQQGLREEARRYYTESLRLTRELSTSSAGLPYLLDSLGREALRHGKHEEARHCYAESLEYRKENGSPREIADSLYQFGQLAYAEGDFEQSLCLFLKVASIYAETDTTTSFYADAVNNAIDTLEGELGSEKVERLKLEMETRTLEEIVNTCLS